MEIYIYIKEAKLIERRSNVLVVLFFQLLFEIPFLRREKKKITFFLLKNHFVCVDEQSGLSKDRYQWCLAEGIGCEERATALGGNVGRVCVMERRARRLPNAQGRREREREREVKLRRRFRQHVSLYHFHSLPPTTRPAPSLQQRGHVPGSQRLIFFFLAYRGGLSPPSPAKQLRVQRRRDEQLIRWC